MRGLPLSEFRCYVNFRRPVPAPHHIGGCHFTSTDFDEAGIFAHLLLQGNIGSIESLIPQVPIGASAPQVGIGLRKNVEDAAGGAAEFRDATGGNRLKFANNVRSEKRPREVCGIIVGRKTIHNKAVIQVALAGDRDSRARNGGGFCETLIVPSVLVGTVG